MIIPTGITCPLGTVTEEAREEVLSYAWTATECGSKHDRYSVAISGGSAYVIHTGTQLPDGMKSVWTPTAEDVASYRKKVGPLRLPVPNQVAQIPYRE